MITRFPDSAHDLCSYIIFHRILPFFSGLPPSVHPRAHRAVGRDAFSRRSRSNRICRWHFVVGCFRWDARAVCYEPHVTGLTCVRASHASQQRRSTLKNVSEETVKKKNTFLVVEPLKKKTKKISGVFDTIEQFKTQSTLMTRSCNKCVYTHTHVNERGTTVGGGHGRRGSTTCGETVAGGRCASLSTAVN